MLFEIQEEILNQIYKDTKMIDEKSQQIHLALQLPEIVNHIISYLVIPYQFEENKKIKFYQHIYPCLFVNRLWHDAAARHIWRHVTFEESKPEIEAFMKFAQILSNPHHSQLNNNKTMYDMDIDQDFNQDPLFLDYKHYSQPYLNQPPQPQMESNSRYRSGHKSRNLNPIQNNLPSGYQELYRNSVRSITLRKIKDKTINLPLESISPYLPRLEKLDIYICDHVSDQTIQSFARHNQGKLTYLSLAGCNRITDEAVLSVAHHCPKLEHLDLRACGLISDRSIQAVAHHCPLLYHLNVGRVRDREKITAASMDLIARNTKVGVLGLAGCDMTDECLVTIARCRKDKLERISVNNCHRITNISIQAYVDYCPNLSVFEMKECHRIDDWGSVAELVQRKVLLTLCEDQNRACLAWARKTGKSMEVKAPLK